MLGTILLIVLILLLVGALPSWPHSRSWGYGPCYLPHHLFRTICTTHACHLAHEAARNPLRRMRRCINWPTSQNTCTAGFGSIHLHKSSTEKRSVRNSVR
jgi:hypothetical protein